MNEDKPISILYGLPGSAGCVAGPAHVVHSLEEVESLQAGEILVVPAALTIWSKCFDRASAIVTDVVGMLGNCTIIARERRIPAVVGTGMQPQLFATGR